MPEINLIPYENAEDLRYFLFDNYITTEMLILDHSGTGVAYPTNNELRLSTGAMELSIAKVYYDNPIFNPLYGSAIFKMRMDSETDCFAFFGFKATTAEPTYDMIESHAGFMVQDGKIYASVGDGEYQQRVEIVGIDPLRVQEYKIEYNRFFIKPLPVTEEQLSLPTVLSVVREWTEVQWLTNYPPENQAHYILHHIKNTTNYDKNIYFYRFIYRQVYAD